jgi:hypothetical protein
MAVPFPTSTRVPVLGEGALEGLEDRVVRALATGDASRLEVLGYGEVSPVLAMRSEASAAACKRLPPFPDERAFEAYRSAFGAQLEAFADGGVPVLPTALAEVSRPGARPVAYCVQPLVEREALLPVRMAREPEAWVGEHVEGIIDVVLGYVGPTRGLDAQLSNWVVVDGRLAYVDVTTPLLRDERGCERLDVDVFLASLPWAVRGLVRRFAVGGILDAYYSPRGVVRDLLANLVKEGLSGQLPALTAVAARRVDPPLSIEEICRHYARDARTWRLLQRLRRLDRAWQRHVRRRPYPFLLPGRVDRRV